MHDTHYIVTKGPHIHPSRPGGSCYSVTFNTFARVVGREPLQGHKIRDEGIVEFLKMHSAVMVSPNPLGLCMCV